MSEQLTTTPQEFDNFDGPGIHSEFVGLSKQMIDREPGGAKKSGRHTAAHMNDKYPYGPVEEHKALTPGGQMELTQGE